MYSPIPERRVSRAAASAAVAPAIPDMSAHWSPNTLSGGSVGSVDVDGQTCAQPPAFATVSSSAANSAYGPVWPNGVIARVTSRGYEARSDVASRPRVAATDSRRSCTSTSAQASSRSSSVRADGRSRVMPRLLRLSARNIPLRSGSGVPAGNGPRRRAGSPSGDSTLTTSAPASPISFAAYADATPVPSSSTLSGSAKDLPPPFATPTGILRRDVLGGSRPGPVAATADVAQCRS